MCAPHNRVTRRSELWLTAKTQSMRVIRPCHNKYIVLPISNRGTTSVQVFNDKSHSPNLYTDTMEVDYRNYDVTLSSLLRVLTDRHAPGTARSKRLLSDGNSNVLVYITGHGGNEFMKIQVRLLASDPVAVRRFRCVSSSLEVRVARPRRSWINCTCCIGEAWVDSNALVAANLILFDTSADALQARKACYAGS